MHTSDPSQHKRFCLYILKFQDSKEFQIHMLELMILYLNDSLKNGCVIFTVRIYLSFKGKVGFCFVHIALNVDDFLEDCKNIRFSMFSRIEKQMALPDFFINKLRLFLLAFKLSLFEVTNNHRRQQFIHPLFVRYLRISPTPNKQDKIEQFKNCLILKELHLLIRPFDILVNLLFKKLIAFL